MLPKKNLFFLRFWAILGCLHMVNNELDRNENDRLWKVRPLLENCAANFQKYVLPEQINAVDEMLVPFKVKKDFFLIHMFT